MKGQFKQAVVEGEEGHVQTAVAAIVSGAGAIALGIGAATDSGVTAIIGGIVAGLGFIAYEAIRHSTLDKEFFGRTDELMKK